MKNFFIIAVVPLIQISVRPNDLQTLNTPYKSSHTNCTLIAGSLLPFQQACSSARA